MPVSVELKQSAVIDEIVTSLHKKQKKLPTKYFYDERGSGLFEQITKVNEYYPTRTEMKIMRDNIREICSYIGPNTLLVELGSGSSIKIKMLLRHLEDIAGYVAIDISENLLMESAKKLRKEFPDIDIYPVHADYSEEIILPEIAKYSAGTVFYYPGSTIGNFKPEEARQFLARIASETKGKGGLLIGVDLKKEKEIIEAAYNDTQGITAEFNLNILLHLNKLIGSNFVPEHFTHFAYFNEEKGRIEMHLLSKMEQFVIIDNKEIFIDKGETLLTEYSYKYDVEEFRELVSDLFSVEKVWTDKNNYFSVQYLKTK